MGLLESKLSSSYARFFWLSCCKPANEYYKTKNCAQLNSFARKGSQLRASKIHLRWKPYIPSDFIVSPIRSHEKINIIFFNFVTIQLWMHYYSAFLF